MVMGSRGLATSDPWTWLMPPHDSLEESCVECWVRVAVLDMHISDCRQIRLDCAWLYRPGQECCKTTQGEVGCRAVQGGVDDKIP